MNRCLWTVIACAALAATLGASDGPTMTVTGCVQNFSAKDAGGTTQKGYLLTNARTRDNGDVLGLAPMPTPGTSVTGAPTGTSGTAAPGMPTSGTWVATTGTPAGSAAASRDNTSLRLDGHHAELKNQVGHRVEVTGTPQRRDADALGAQEAHFLVASIRQLSSNCSSK